MSSETSARPETKRIGVRELRNDLSSFLRQVESGESFLITSHDKVIAVLSPAPVPERRLPGALKGQIWIADDFDTWPEDILDCFEREL
jgi:prevent-host-death family protein